MKRLFLVLCLVMVPVSFMFALWQAYSYQTLETEVSRMEKERQSLFEEHKRLVAEYGAESSPGVVEDRAMSELGMNWPTQDQVVKVKKPAGGER